MVRDNGNRGKPARKPVSKQVIDYDPLAWLGETGETTEAEVSKPVMPFSDDEPVESSAEVAAETAAEPADEAGFGFFEETPAPVDISKKDVNMNEDSAGEEAAYGFFDEAESGETEPGSTSSDEDPADESPAYGFFDEIPLTGSDTGPWKDEDAVIHLGPELVIRCVAQAHALIAETLSDGFDIRLDAGDLQKIDSAGLQMIYSLGRTLEKTGQTISWVCTSPLIDQRAAELGLPKLSWVETDDPDNASFGFF